MSKERRSVSLDGHVNEYVKDDTAEFSPLVNKWTRDYYENGHRPSMEPQEIEDMRQALRDERERLHQVIDESFDRQERMLETMVETVEQVDETVDEQVTERIDDVYKQVSDWQRVTLKSSPLDYKNYGVSRDPEHPAIEKHAQELGMTPERLVKELRERDRENGYLPEMEINQ